MKTAIISGKGGSGKSTVSAAFIALAGDVVAVDCDVDASNLPLLFKHEVLASESFASGHVVNTLAEKCVGCGRCAEACVYHAIEMSEGKAVVNPLLCEGCGLCEKICPSEALRLESEAGSIIYESHFDYGDLIHGDLKPGDDNSGLMIARLRKIADKKMAEKGATMQILDGPPGIGCPVISTITGADKVIIVCEPTLSGVSDLKRAYQAAISFCVDISVIINKADINTANRNDVRTFCSDMRLPILAELPFDRVMVESQINRLDIISYAPESECAYRLREAYKKII